MYKTVEESVSFIEKLKERSWPSEVDAVICAPFLSLPTLVQKAGQTIGIGAQNAHQQPEGAYTGEVSIPMLKAIGVNYVIIGHSERRAYFAETDESVNQKVHVAIAGGITPIICVGEEIAEREAEQTTEVVGRQVTAAFKDVAASDAAKAVVAYEPVWAIGSGKAATAEDAEEVCAFIRRKLTDLYSQDVAEQVRIQYGGSVKPSNIATFMSQANIDGALVGGASLEVDSFVQLLVGAKSS